MIRRPNDNIPQVHYDDIIVGAGSAGSVMAARLSEDSSRDVLLIEAGPDYPDIDSIPPDLLQPKISLLKHDWGLMADKGSGQLLHFPRGKVVGGSSAVNQSVALRGMAADYDEWAAMTGSEHWNWHNVRQCFTSMERAEGQLQTDYYGTDGILPINQCRLKDLEPLQRAFHDACCASGLASLEDLNNPRPRDGVAPLAMNCRNGVNVSSAIAYLLPARQRHNLKLRSHCLADRVLFDGNRSVCGVEVRNADSSVEHLHADRVAICAGAIHTPALLLRSGLGAANDLRELGIAVIADLPGVGAGLIDHPGVGIWGTPYGATAESHDPNERYRSMAARYTADGSQDPHDMQLFLFNDICIANTPFESMVRAQSLSAVTAVLQRPLSRGSVQLVTTDPNALPMIRLNYLSHPEDRRRMIDGVRKAWRIAQSSELKPYIGEFLIFSDSLIESTKGLNDVLNMLVSTAFHPAGTASMGGDDRQSVVDEYCRVHTVHNLWVADASVIPTALRASLNLTCMMIGEKAAGWMSTGVPAKSPDLKMDFEELVI